MKKRTQQSLPGRPSNDSINNKQIRRAGFLVEASNTGRRSSIAYGKQLRQDTRPINDRNYQISSIRAINAYIQSHGFSVTISPKSLPSGKDVKEIIHFLFRQLDPGWELCKLEDDVPFLFRQYGYPFQINKSALYAAGSPHSWPGLLAGLAWLVELLNYKEKIEDEAPWFSKDNTFEYIAQSYECFLKGDDVAVEALDQEIILQMEEERAVVAQRRAAVENLVRDMEAKVEGFKTGPSAVDSLEKNKSVLANDVLKFHSIVNNFSAKKESLEKCLVERKQELEAKTVEIEKLTKENEVLKQQVESQHVNIRDYEKMSRECQSIEHDIHAAEASRNQWEEKAWELEVSASKKLKELEGAIDRYNQEIIRLKLGNSFEYKLNPRGVTPVEILGVDFKDTLKPRIISCTEDYERTSREKWEESIAIQQQLHDKGSEQEGKRKLNTSLLTKIKKLEARCGAIRKSMEEYISLKTAECERVSTEIENNEHDMKKKEIEAYEHFKKATTELENVTKRYDEEIQVCSNELLRFLDAIAKHKEHVESTISTVKTGISEVVQEVNSMYTRRNKA
eukprot:Gb_08872 [translate_table: standard]